MTSNFKFSQCADQMNAGDAGLRLLGMPSHVLVWFLAYAYAFVIAIVLQKLVMPLMPNLHAGHGLMNYDAIIFHDMAVAMANRVHEFGWSEWRLIPGQGITANVGILAAIYALLGPDPVWFIPLSAGFHALGATLIMRIAALILPGKSGLLAGVVTALLFLVFPSSLVWYGQNHKDGFLIAGYLLVVFAYVRAVGRSSLKVAIARDVYLMVAGCFLIAVMRPHMMVVYAVAFPGAFFGAVLIQLIKTRRARTTYIFNGAMMLAILMFAAAMTPSASSEFTTTRSSIVGEVLETGWSWEKSGLLPDFVEKKLEQVSFVRTYFIYTGKSVAAGSIIDEDITPTNAVDMAAYLPRALWVGIFSPFPNSWLVRPTLPRVIGVIETLIFYLAAAGILILAWRKPSLNLFSCLLVSSLVLVVLSYTSPNVGTLHRIRYGPLFIFMLAGISGWVLLVTSVSVRLGKTLAPRHREAALQQSVPAQITTSTNLSGQQVIGAGALVTLISVVGGLSSLIRDLLLINRIGFGAELDGFYLVMMLPMLFVSVFTLPLGDTLASALGGIKSSRQAQRMLGATLSASLLLSGLIVALLLANAGTIFRRFVNGAGIDQVHLILPAALILFLLSGLVVSGNSLMNHLCKPVLTASFQLIVPILSIVAILAAPIKWSILMAVAGMALGQLLNLVALYFVVKAEGYQLLPGSLNLSYFGKKTLSNYAWLVISAFLMALFIPLNYWLAGQLDVGVISIWALGNKLVLTAITICGAMMSAVWVPYLSKLVAAGFRSKIRDEVYLSILVCCWSCGLISLVLMVFIEPTVVVAFPLLHDTAPLQNLSSIFQLAAMQLPIAIPQLMLLKLSAASKITWKVLFAYLVGLAANLALGYMWTSTWGVMGVASAWLIATLLTALIIMFVTRSQSSLGWGECFCILGGWLVIAAFALAIYVKSLPIAVGATIIAFLVIFVQIRSLIKVNILPIAVRA